MKNIFVIWYEDQIISTYDVPYNEYLLKAHSGMLNAPMTKDQEEAVKQLYLIIQELPDRDPKKIINAEDYSYIIISGVLTL